MPGDATVAAAASVLAVATAPLTVAEANDGRRQVSLFNGGPNTVYLGYGQPAVASQGWPLPAQQPLTEDYFAGEITAICAAGASAALFRLDVG